MPRSTPISPSVLIIDDEADILSLLSEYLADSECEVRTAADSIEIATVLERGAFDVVVLDVHLEGTAASDLITHFDRYSPDTQVILITGKPSMESALDAIRFRAFDYLAKPISQERFVMAVERAGEVSRVKAENRHYREHLEELVRERTRMLQESEQRYEQIVDNSLVGIFIYQAGLIKYVNPRLAEILGYEGAYGKAGYKDLDPMAFIHEADRARLELYRRARLANEPAPRQYECRLMSRYGYAVWTEIFISEVTYDNEPALMGNVIDITDRKRAKVVELALEESERRYQALFELSLDAMIIHEDGEIIDVNQASIDLTSYSYQDLVGMTWVELISPEWRADVIRRVLDDDDRPLEVIGVTKDGRRYDLEVTTKPFSHHGRAFHVTELKDVSEQHRAAHERAQLEEQLFQAQKMEAVGRLAGGIAHDFNNLMQGIIGYTDLMLLELSPEEPAVEDVHNIKDAARRAAVLTEQLLAFSRKREASSKPIDLNERLRETEGLIRRLMGEHLDLATHLDASPAWVMADPGHLDQVLFNLVVNGKDAMGPRGILVIETTNVTVDEATALSHTDVVPGEFVVMAVSDSGVGMNEETRQRIFEPFFTTKRVGEGTGLGLSTVYGIVKQSGGFITVDSEVGAGSTFRIHLPLTSRRQDSEPEALSTSMDPLSGMVLLVEDDDVVRELAARVLTSRGFDVLQAGTVASALDESRRYEGPIHLLLTDVVMPIMNGMALYSRLKETRPELRVLYMSGYSSDELAKHGSVDEGAPFISKPFSMAELINAVWDTISSY